MNQPPEPLVRVQKPDFDVAAEIAALSAGRKDVSAVDCELLVQLALSKVAQSNGDEGVASPSNEVRLKPGDPARYGRSSKVQMSRLELQAASSPPRAGLSVPSNPRTSPPVSEIVEDGAIRAIVPLAAFNKMPEGSVHGPKLRDLNVECP